MGIIHLLIVLAIVGVILYIINRPEVPIDGKFKKIINWVIVIVVVIWLLRILFSSTYFHDVKI